MSFSHFRSQLSWHPSCRHFVKLENIMKCGVLTHDLSVNILQRHLVSVSGFPSLWLQPIQCSVYSQLIVSDLDEKHLLLKSHHLWTSYSIHGLAVTVLNLHSSMNLNRFHTFTIQKLKKTELCSSLVQVTSGVAIFILILQRYVCICTMLSPTGHSARLPTYRITAWNLDLLLQI